MKNSCIYLFIFAMILMITGCQPIISSSGDVGIIGTGLVDPKNPVQVSSGNIQKEKNSSGNTESKIK
jgi:hypothetical protein